MLTQAWQEEAILSKTLLKKLWEEEELLQYSGMHSPIKPTQLGKIMSLPPMRTLLEAAEDLSSENVHYALIQSSPTIILGVLRSEALFDVISDGDTMAASISVANVMDRDFCVEPNSATLFELLNRAYFGRNQSCVIVDSLGNPEGILSLRELIAMGMQALHKK